MSHCAQRPARLTLPRRNPPVVPGRGQGEEGAPGGGGEHAIPATPVMRVPTRAAHRRGDAATDGAALKRPRPVRRRLPSGHAGGWAGASPMAGVPR